MTNQIEQLEGRLFLSASVSGGTLTVTGTESADRIVITQQKKSVLVREGSHLSRFGKSSHISQIVVNALGGNDRIKITGKTAAGVAGGEGNDVIEGGAANDVLAGGNGNDRIFGNGGADSISGDGGRDVLFGGAGDDMIDAYDTHADRLTGGAGSDKARVDTDTDTAWNIEGYLAIESSGPGAPVNVSSSGTLAVNAGNIAGNGTFIHTGALQLDGSGANVTLGSGGQAINVSGFTTVEGFHAVRLYAADLDAAKAMLYAAINANASGATNPLDGILDAGAHPGSSVDIALVGDHIYIRPTRIGDLNLDGSVTIADFISNFSSGSGTWQEGGINNYNGNVTIADFIDLASKFNNTLGGSGTITGQITADTGGHIDPGAGVGTLTVGGLDLSGVTGGNLTDPGGFVAGDYVLIDYSGTPLDDSIVASSFHINDSPVTGSSDSYDIILNLTPDQPADSSEPTSS